MIKTVKIDSENFETFVNEKQICLVDIWAEWCSPCKQISPIIDEISSEVNENILICKMEAESNMDFCKKYEVRNIPTLLLFKNGEVVDRSTGIKSKRDILNMISSHYED